MRAALATVALARRRTAIWIVSGRTVGELETLLGLERLVDLWGSHGMERRSRHGRWTGPPPDAAARALLRTVSEVLVRRAGPALVERKRYGLAIHERGSDPDAYRSAAVVLREVESEAARHGLSLAPFDGGLELRPRGFHKGLVVERAFAELGEDAAVAYLGDDATDEDAFAALRGRGLAVLVRREPRRTRADVCLRSPGEVLGFLGAWAEACRADGP
jgi:trehalose-phosphatase